MCRKYRCDEIEELGPGLIRHELELIDEKLVDLRVLRVTTRGMKVALELCLRPFNEHCATQNSLQFVEWEELERLECQHLFYPLPESSGLHEYAIREPQLRQEVHKLLQVVHS